MHSSADDMIGQLVAELRPIRPLRQRIGMVRIVLALGVGAVIVGFGVGIRADILAGVPDPMFLISSGLFLVLALASGWGAVDMARPFVGTRREGWAWTAAMAAVLPAGAIGLIGLDLARGRPLYVDTLGPECMTVGCSAGLLTLIVLVLWLRRGAPSSPRLAGLLAGVAAGAAGIFAVSLCCPENSLVHIGLWHGGTVIVMGLFGRLALPRFLAW